MSKRLFLLWLDNFLDALAIKLLYKDKSSHGYVIMKKKSLALKTFQIKCMSK